MLAASIRLSIGTGVTIREDLNKRRNLPTFKRCKVGALLDDLGINHPDEYDALLDAIMLVRDARNRSRPDDIFTIQWLHDVLTSNGYAIGKTVVSDHVRKVCACDNRQ